MISEKPKCNECGHELKIRTAYGGHKPNCNYVCPNCGNLQEVNEPNCLYCGNPIIGDWSVHYKYCDALR